MTKTSDLPRAFRDGAVHPLPPEAPDLFTPEQVIFRQLDFDESNQPYYSIIDAPTRYREGKFAKLIRRMANGEYTPNSRDDEENHRLDIPVHRDSYVAIRIARDEGFWGHPAVFLGSAGRPYPSNYYGQLRYVAANGDMHDGLIPNCRLVVFAALFRPNSDLGPYTQSFGMRVPGARFHGDIDPDIRYPGNGAAPEEVGGNG